MPNHEIYEGSEIRTDYTRRWQALLTAIDFYKYRGHVSVADIAKTAEEFYAFAAVVLTTSGKAPTPQVATEHPDKP